VPVVELSGRPQRIRKSQVSANKVLELRRNTTRNMIICDVLLVTMEILVIECDLSMTKFLFSSQVRSEEVLDRLFVTKMV
jgi:hypothetical protein